MPLEKRMLAERGHFRGWLCNLSERLLHPECADSSNLDVQVLEATSKLAQNAKWRGRDIPLQLKLPGDRKLGQTSKLHGLDLCLFGNLGRSPEHENIAIYIIPASTVSFMRLGRQ